MLMMINTGYQAWQVTIAIIKCYCKHGTLSVNVALISRPKFAAKQRRSSSCRAMHSKPVHLALMKLSTLNLHMRQLWARFWWLIRVLHYTVGNLMQIHLAANFHLWSLLILNYSMGHEIFFSSSLCCQASYWKVLKTELILWLTGCSFSAFWL